MTCNFLSSYISKYFLQIASHLSTYEDYFVNFLIIKDLFLSFRQIFANITELGRKEGGPLCRFYANVKLLHISANVAERLWPFVAGTYHPVLMRRLSM